MDGHARTPWKGNLGLGRRMTASKGRAAGRAYLERGAAFSARRAFTMRVTRAAGRGRSGVKWRVPFPASNGFSSAENWRRTLALAAKRLQWSLYAAVYT